MTKINIGVCKRPNLQGLVDIYIEEKAVKRPGGLRPLNRCKENISQSIVASGYVE